MRIAGVDASFTRTGLTLMDYSEKTIECFRESTDIRDKSFQGTVKAVNQLTSKISKRLEETSMVFLEEPFPNGDYSSGLFALDTYLIFTLKSKGKKVWSFNPTTIKHIMGHRGPKKSESVELADQIVKVLLSKGWKDLTDHRKCHDEAESLIYAIWGSLKVGLLIDNDIVSLKKAFKEVTKNAKL